MFSKGPVVTALAMFLILVLLIYPLSHLSPQDIESNTFVPEEEKVEIVHTSPPTVQPDQELDKSLDLNFHAEIIPSNRGFQLYLDKEQYPELVATVSTNTQVIHAFKSYRSEETDVAHYDSVVVNPDTQEFKIFPMYEIGNDLPSITMPFTVIDEQHVMFVRPTWIGEQLSYDLVQLDLNTGSIDTIVERFWELTQNAERYVEDYLVSVHYANQDQAHSEVAYSRELILTSYKGQVWYYKVGDTVMRTDRSHLYPAFGDLGSTPPRELIFPSQDLKRFVSQEREKPNFQVINTQLNDVVGEFDFDSSKIIMDPGIKWSPNNSRFYIEYGERDRAIVINYDNSLVVFAQGIRIYDLEGKMINNLELPLDSNKRMNVYGWANEGQLWIQYFRPVTNEREEKLKEDISYKLYDVSTGKMTDYKITDSINKLHNVSIVRKHNGLSLLEVPFLMVDQDKRLIWQPVTKSRAIMTADQLYMQVESDDLAHMYRWDSAQHTWNWITADAGELIDNDRYFRMPLVHQEEWLLYPPQHNEQAIDYVRIGQLAASSIEGLPFIPGKFVEGTGQGEWWENGATEKSDKTSIRVSGDSRYGSIQVESYPGEVFQRYGGIQYYGDYRVGFIDLQGNKTTLPDLVELALYQEQTPTTMRKYEFDGYDVLLFQPQSYRFSKGYVTGTTKVMAYAITKQGKAFPLEFRYQQDTVGLQNSSSFLIDDKGSVERKGNHIIAHTLLNDNKRYEVEWTPDLLEKTLTVTAIVDQSAQYKELTKIVTRYSNFLEQGLGLEDIDLPEGRMDEKKLRKLFAKQAWNNPGFQYLYNSFSESKKKGNSSRAFAWQPIDAEFVSSDTIRFTFTLNLWYAIGLAGHLEVGLKLVDGEWTFHDFGTLETEKMEDDPTGYGGLLLEDPLILK